MEGASGEAGAVEFSGLEANIPSIGSNAAGFGSFNIIPQKDGIYREANLVDKYEGNLYPNLAVEALSKYYESPVILNIAEYGIDSIEIGGRRVPLDEGGALLLNFYGPGGTFTAYSAVDVMSGRRGEGLFRDKLVFLGVTEKGIYDIRPTPLDTLYPGVEILATVAGSVIDERYLIHDSRTVIFDIAMVAALPLIFSLAVSFVRSTASSLVFFLYAAAFVALPSLSVFASSMRVSVVYPSFRYLRVSLKRAYRNIVVEKKSRYLKGLSTYVSTQLVSRY